MISVIKIVQYNTIDFSIYNLPYYADLHGLHDYHYCLEVIKIRFPGKIIIPIKVPFVSKWFVFVI